MSAAFEEFEYLEAWSEVGEAGEPTRVDVFDPDALAYLEAARRAERARLCRRGLHDLGDPNNRASGQRGCRPCKNAYQVARRRLHPAYAPRRRPGPRGIHPDLIDWGENRLDPVQLAYLRSLVPCVGCGALPGPGPDGYVGTEHAEGCRVPWIPEGGE